MSSITRTVNLCLRLSRVFVPAHLQQSCDHQSLASRLPLSSWSIANKANMPKPLRVRLRLRPHNQVEACPSSAPDKTSAASDMLARNGKSKQCQAIQTARFLIHRRSGPLSVALLQTFSNSKTQLSDDDDLYDGLNTRRHSNVCHSFGSPRYCIYTVYLAQWTYQPSVGSTVPEPPIKQHHVASGSRPPSPVHGKSTHRAERPIRIFSTHMPSLFARAVSSPRLVAENLLTDLGI
jgi:hypothetical protein